MDEGTGDYGRLLDDLRAIIGAGRGRAYAAINRELVATYWSVGERIVREEQGMPPGRATATNRSCASAAP